MPQIGAIDDARQWVITNLVNLSVWELMLAYYAGRAILLLLPWLSLLPLPPRPRLQAAKAAHACCQSSGARARATASNTEAVKKSSDRMLDGVLPRSLPSELLQSRRAGRRGMGLGAVVWSLSNMNVHSIQRAARPRRRLRDQDSRQQAHLKRRKSRLRCTRAAAEGSVSLDAALPLPRASTSICSVQCVTLNEVCDALSYNKSQCWWW